MKKLLVLVIALVCFVGCGKDSNPISANHTVKYYYLENVEKIHRSGPVIEITDRSPDEISFINQFYGDTPNKEASHAAKRGLTIDLKIDSVWTSFAIISFSSNEESDFLFWLKFNEGDTVSIEKISVGINETSGIKIPY